MKKLYIKDIKKIKIGDDVEIFGWIKSIRYQKSRIFIILVDSTGEIQVVCNKIFKHLKAEISVKVLGKTVLQKNKIEILSDNIEILGNVDIDIQPHPRRDFNVFSEQYANNIANNRHIYIRNPKIIAALKARDLVVNALRAWFITKSYCEVTAPILTPVLLYSEDTGIKVSVNKQEVFLTQCVGFYLESAVHALERVYNIGPSFRAKETSSKHHLTEYWHVKSELAFCEFEEFFNEIEDMLKFITEYIKKDALVICNELKTEFNGELKIPFPRIKYCDALALLEKNGINIKFGQNLNNRAKKFLSQHFNSSVWVTHNPRIIEGFPYKICKTDERLTYTADLITSKGHGELLGIAEKITDYTELEKRLAEKGKDSNSGYQWFKDLRRFGTVPYCGMGMGLERLIKWLFDLNHVRDAIPFPRNIGRKIYP